MPGQGTACVRDRSLRAEDVRYLGRNSVKNPWEERFARFWYNGEEILQFTEADSDRRAAESAANGITTVTAFCCTHFRWNCKS